MPYYIIGAFQAAQIALGMQENFLDTIFGILFILCPSKQATRPSPLLEWEMANTGCLNGQFQID